MSFRRTLLSLSWSFVILLLIWQVSSLAGEHVSQRLFILSSMTNDSVWLTLWTRPWLTKLLQLIVFFFLTHPTFPPLLAHVARSQLRRVIGRSSSCLWWASHYCSCFIVIISACVRFQESLLWLKGVDDGGEGIRKCCWGGNSCVGC